MVSRTSIFIFGVTLSESRLFSSRVERSSTAARSFQLLTLTCAAAVVGRLAYRGFVHRLRLPTERLRPLFQLVRLPAVLVTMIVQSLPLSDRVHVAQVNRFLQGHCQRHDVHKNSFYSLHHGPSDDLLRQRLQKLASVCAVGLRLVSSPDLDNGELRDNWNALRPTPSLLAPLLLRGSLKALDASRSGISPSFVAQLTQLTWLRWHNCDASMPRLASSLVGLQHLGCDRWEHPLDDLIRMLK